jgi:chromosome segregation protein
MYLKNLTVLGFKSFAEKTSLNFLPGVTAIVGPNGCGKSNVSDAIRWVLGEQSAKALRGGEMADVIFNGTDNRKAMGMAEVSLTVGDMDQSHLQAAGIELNYNEVTISRRVFRDGTGEYFINKTPCRLKDIQQLFMGTGVGRTSYSIMAQGNITQILSSKPEDRRLVFEEAAGITKFKSQKREALRKLELTEQNLLRVQDLIREVKRQIGSLQRQAGKARRYKVLSQELQHLETQLARHEFDILQVEIADRLAAAGNLRQEIESASQRVLHSEEQIRERRACLSELEHRISDSQQKGLEVKSQAERHEQRVQVNQDRLRELAEQNARALADIAQAEERRLVAEQELGVVLDHLRASRAALEKKKVDLQTRQEALGQIDEDLRLHQESLRTAQADAFEAAQQLSRHRNQINALDLQKQGNLVRLEKLSSEKIQLEEERLRLEQRLADFAAEVEAEKQQVITQRSTMEQRQQRLRQIQEELSQTAQELDTLLTQQVEQRSRWNVLEQLEASHEGFSAGALAALGQAQSVIGSLADRIRVPDSYVAAIESALGHHLQLVLTDQPETAQQILADLSAQHKGRASVAALGLGPQSNGHVLPEVLSREICRPALEVVEADPTVQPLLRGLLGRTMIVSDLAAATSAWQACQGACDFVTRSGDLLTGHGIYTGGATNGTGNAPASILGRKNQIADLQARLGRLQETTHELSRRKGGLQSEQTALQAGLQEAQKELRAQEVAIATREGEYNALQQSLRGLQQKIETVVYEIQSLVDLERDITAQRQALTTQLAKAEAGEQQAAERVSRATQTLETLRLQRDQANTALTEAKVAEATEEQLCSSFTKQQSPLEERIRELQHLAAQRRGEIDSVLQRRNQLESEMGDSRRQIERLAQERALVNQQTAELHQQRNAQESEIQTQEEDLRQDRSRLNELQQNRGDLEVELAQKNMTVQNLRERIQQKYRVNLDDVRSECINIIYADQGPARIQTLTPDEMEQAGVSTNWTAVAEQVTALQKRLEEMGPVNLVAIEEYEETEQRYQFLTTQHNDLAKAKEQLLDAINRINVQTREMFCATFSRIRESFQSMFIEIFGGGKADLRLVDENDVLESGIEIVARPPGKQLQNISLLSGGEQTMTAVALLFSIYQVKPSPFCVLDELDAPLDESNINRFTRILKRFLEYSQFIVITHNKRTIAMADILYGVTMEEQGVSKIVSVKFHKAEEDITDHAPASLETPVLDHALEEEEDKLQPREETLEVLLAK